MGSGASRLVGAALSLLLAASACTTAPEPEPEPSVTEGISDPALTRTCTSEEGSYRISYPEDWYANDPAESDPCSFFHPEPFTLPEASEALGIAISVSLADTPFAELTSDETFAAEVLDRRESLVAGHDAVRVSTESTGEALLDVGVKGVSWFVDLPDSTLVATTRDIASAGSFVDNTAVLDAMLNSLELTSPTGDGGPPPAAACSASGLSATPDDQPGLPEAVAETRREIVEAAVACDYQGLAAIASESADFNYSFGDSGDPAGYWEGLEDDGSPVLETLVQVLDTPHTENASIHAWPSAFGYDTWEAVPQADRDALNEIYDSQDFEGFEQFGSYVGYRVGINDSGDWLFYVAGD